MPGRIVAEIAQNVISVRSWRELCALCGFSDASQGLRTGATYSRPAAPNAMLTFSPPKANELDRAFRAGMGRATFGT